MFYFTFRIYLSTSVLYPLLIGVLFTYKKIPVCAKKPDTKHLNSEGGWKQVPGKNNQTVSVSSYSKSSPLQCTVYMCSCVYMQYPDFDRYTLFI